MDDCENSCINSFYEYYHRFLAEDITEYKV